MAKKTASYPETLSLWRRCRRSEVSSTLAMVSALSKCSVCKSLEDLKVHCSFGGGTGFLTRFEGSVMNNDILKRITLIDTPGGLALAAEPPD
eukprot:scaffold1130_cov195-Pinguiococcus_pyrenoidosus.AAC.98